MSRAESINSFPSLAEAVLDALPHPVMMIAPDGKIANANAAASFFEVSVLLLRRYALQDLVPFCSPLLSLIDQVRGRGAAVNEYKVDLGTPRNPGERIVDLHVAPVSERPRHVVVMLQERTIADKMDRQLTHRGAARSVIALAAMLAHEIKNPLSGIRGAAQLLEQQASDDDRILTRLTESSSWWTAWKCSATSARWNASRSISTWSSITCGDLPSPALPDTSGLSKNTILRCRRCSPIATSSSRYSSTSSRTPPRRLAKAPSTAKSNSPPPSGPVCACRFRAANRRSRCRSHSASRTTARAWPTTLCRICSIL